MDKLTASDLSLLVNAYSISNGDPKTIMIPQASQLAKLQDVSVSGTLLKKQSIALDPATNQRRIALGANNGAYTRQEPDGDLHFCLGIQQGDPHLASELQNASPWIGTFNGAIGQDVTVSGFFRCLFEHPGFHHNDDAHIFEIHPVRAATLNGAIQPFDVDSPDPAATHTWTVPHNLNEQDSLVSVVYDQANDVLTFSGMQGLDENYVAVSGDLSDVQLNEASAAPASFTFTSPDITNPIQVFCMKGTSAALQLSQLQADGTTSISMIGLRNIDLSQALLGQYVINLLAIDIQAT